MEVSYYGWALCTAPKLAVCYSSYTFFFILTAGTWNIVILTWGPIYSVSKASDNDTWRTSPSVAFFLYGNCFIYFHNPRQLKALRSSEFQGKGGGFPEQALNAGSMNQETRAIVKLNTTSQQHFCPWRQLVRFKSDDKDKNNKTNHHPLDKLM